MIAVVEMWRDAVEPKGQLAYQLVSVAALYPDRCIPDSLDNDLGD